MNSFPYKAVLADIDGTLCQKGGQLGPKTKAALESLHEAGILLGLATGRAINQRVFTMRDFWNLPFQFDVIIGMNGGQLWTADDPHVKNFHLLSEDTMREILRKMRPLDLNALIYEEEHMVAMRRDIFQEESMKRNKTEVIFTNGDEERLCVRPNNNILFRYDPEREAEVLAYAETLACDRYRGMRTAPGCLEFMDPRVNKGEGLRQYAANAGIPAAEIMAFGDNDNDAEMLGEAGHGVCLKNGSDASKKLADAVTEYPCEDDGLGRYLFDHWLEER